MRRHTVVALLMFTAAGCAVENDTSLVEGDAAAVDRVEATRDASGGDAFALPDARRTDAGGRTDAITPDGGVRADVPAAQDVPSGVQVNAWLELRLMDLWAQPLPAGGYALQVARDGAPVTPVSSATPGVVRVP